ncbi:MAG: 50S ribosomal protein L9 [Candidatus Pacebacteria bacterium]|nr:50S ribosomal protein L9 [Candidatus Paceibacterota bacterium]
MKVILIKDVQNLGHTGDVKEVSGGYAKNFLIPGGYAKVATESIIKKADEMKAQKDKEKETELEKAKEVVAKIQGQSVTIKAKADPSKKLYAAVKAEEIAEALTTKGFEVDKDSVVIDEPIKELGDFEVTLNLEHGLEARIGVTVEAE